MNPNGIWTLYLADMSGGTTSTLMGWSLDIMAVPEPTILALAVFGIGLASVLGFRRWRRARGNISE